MPQNAAGWRIEPPVSVPVANGTMPAATAAAEPPDDPPGTRAASHGLRTGPKWLFSFEDPIANSSMFALPIVTAFAPASRATTVASYGGTKPSSMRDPHVVRIPFVQKISLCTKGIPQSGAAAPRASAASARSAAASAAASACVIKAFSGAFARAASSARRVISTAEVSRARRACACCAMLELMLRLLDDFRHEVETAARLAGERQQRIGMVRLGHRVGAPGQRLVVRMRQ